MSNYPNMSYCMCENTLAAMNQVTEAMYEDGVEFLKDMNSHERRAFQELFNACEAFMQMSEELQEELEQEEEVDNA